MLQVVTGSLHGGGDVLGQHLELEQGPRA